MAYKEMLRRRAVLRAIGATSRQARVLDVGCGTGRGLSYLLAAGFHRLAGVDYTIGMLERIPGNLSSQHPGVPMSLVRGDAFCLPFPDKAFDLVTAFNFLHMFRLDLQHRLIEEMRRVCRPGGMLVVEFESLHKGLFFTRYPEQRRVAHRTKFTSLAERALLFPKDRFARVRVFGTTLPVCYRLFSFMPRLGALLESVALRPPCNWLSERVIVAGQLSAQLVTAGSERPVRANERGVGSPADVGATTTGRVTPSCITARLA